MNNQATITIPAALLSTLLEQASTLAQYVADEGRDPDSGAMIAQAETVAAVEAVTAYAIGRIG